MDDRKPVVYAAALSSPAIADLAKHCAPATPANVVQAIVGVESGGHALLIAVNGTNRRILAPKDTEAASLQVAALQTSSANFDLGLMQLNSVTLRHLHIPAAQALEPCRNIAIGARLFEDGYAKAMTAHRASIPLLAAYSTYNTGDATRGYANGYADRVDARLRADAGRRSDTRS